jgi:FAD/FMN-containing dehydrogenase
MRGKVVLPSDDAYDSVRHAVDHRPALLAICETPEDVKAAVRIAKAHQLPLSVRGGGHDWAGRALRHEGLVIDLSAMRQVAVNATVRVANVAGGARAKDVIAATAPHGLAAVTGNCGAVGMAGVTLGGGYGPLTPRFGLALDNLLGAEVVLADGRHITADALQHADLFWAIRGGGNFGVVTSMRVRLHPIREMLAGLILFPWSELRKPSSVTNSPFLRGS